MAHINVFIAGSKSLVTYREQLIIWANAKNYKYREQGQETQINPYSFKEVGDDQDKYNQIITEHTDIVLFIVEKNIKDKTKEELTKAKETFAKHQQPKIWIFTKDLEENAKAYFEGVLGSKYTVDFCSPQDLINQVNSRMDEYVKLKIDTELSSRKKKEKLFLSSWRGGVILACVICSLIGGFITQVILKTGNPKLLIAGGGSVANFIETQHKTAIPTLADYPNGYYLHLPTKSAWKMLEEEVVSLQDTRRYYPICLSATKATDEDFCNAQITKQMYLDSAIIIACNLGYDSLAIYLKEESDFFDKHPDYLRNRHISIPILKQLIEDTTLNVYSTSFESGTRDGYCKILGYENEELTEYLAGQFSENSPESSISKENKPYLLLGSQYYYMKAVEDEVIKLTVQSDYVKPMMVYFMAYRKSGDNYEIPQVTIDFLHQLNYSDLDDYIDSNRTIKIRNHEHVIYSCKDLK